MKVTDQTVSMIFSMGIPSACWYYECCFCFPALSCPLWWFQIAWLQKKEQKMNKRKWWRRRGWTFDKRISLWMKLIFILLRDYMLLFTTAVLLVMLLIFRLWATNKEPMCMYLFSSRQSCVLHSFDIPIIYFPIKPRTITMILTMTHTMTCFFNFNGCQSTTFK